MSDSSKGPGKESGSDPGKERPRGDARPGPETPKKTAGDAAKSPTSAVPKTDAGKPDSAKAGAGAGGGGDSGSDKGTSEKPAAAQAAGGGEAAAKDAADKADKGAGSETAKAGAGTAGTGQSSAATRAAAARPAETRAAGAGSSRGGSRGGGRLLAGVLLGALLVVAIAGATVYSRPYWEPYAVEWFGLAPADTGMSEELAALDARIEGLAQAQNRLDSRISDLAAAMPAGERIAALEQRLSELDSRVERLSTAAASGAADAELARELADRLAALEQRAADAETLEAETQALRDQLSSLTEQVGRLADDGPAGQVRLLLGVLQLRDALRGSAPFADELAMLRGLAADDPDLQAALEGLGKHADSGIPTLEQLRARFPAVARQAVAAGAGEGEDGWLAGVKRQLTNLATLRPVGSVEGDHAAAVVARAEQALEAGDLSGAVAELETLDGPAAEAAADWLAAARARLAAHQTLSALGAKLGRALDPAGG